MVKRKQQQILRTAEIMFNRFGVKKTAVDDIAADLFECRDLGAPGQSAAAVFFAEAKAEEIAVAEGLDELARVGDLVPVHLPDQVGGHLLFDEGADLLLQGDLFRGQQNILQHGNPSL